MKVVPSPQGEHEATRRIVTGRYRTPLTPSEAAELTEFLCRLAVQAYDTGACWHAHITYARRAAVALDAGDLFAAQRSAAIATEALRLFHNGGGVAPTMNYRPATAGEGC